MTTVPVREPLVLLGPVMLGSLVGGVTRGWLGHLVLNLVGPGFPWGTLAVNVLGSLAIGAYAALTEPGGRLFASPRQRQFVTTGFCGGFTTFSLFGVETVRLFGSGDGLAALAYVGLSIGASLGAVWLGYGLVVRQQRLSGG